MDFLNNIKDSAKSFAGNIPKAMLIVRNPESIEKDVYGYFKDPKSRTNSNGERFNPVDPLLELRKGLVGKYKSNKGQALRFDDVKGIATPKGDNTDKYVVMEVQYNPSTLKLNTFDGKNYTREGGRLIMMDYPVATTLSVQLVFDDMNVQDAFMLSNLNPNLGNMGSMVRDKIGGFEESKEFNVQTPLDGMLALLQREETRFVMFVWSGFFFPGEVCRVSVRYSMFNKKGNPVRGTADIEIRQTIEEKTTKSGKPVPTYWDEAYNEFFDDESNAGGGFSGVNNNILGINM